MLGLQSYKTAQNPRLRQVAKRTLSHSHLTHRLPAVGTIATLMSSIANISAVFALKGREPAFVLTFSFHLTLSDMSCMLYCRRRLLRRRFALYFYSLQYR